MDSVNFGNFVTRCKDKAHVNVGQVHDGRRAGDGRAVHVLQVQAGGQAVLCYKVAPHLDKVSLHRIITYRVFFFFTGTPLKS